MTSTKDNQAITTKEETCWQYAR